MRHFFWSGLGAFGAGVLLCLALRWVTGDRFAVVRLGVYLMPWILALLTAGTAAACLAGRFRVALLLVAPAAIIGVSYAPLFLPRFTAQAGRPALKVVSYNIWFFNERIAEAGELIRSLRPDLLLLQEVRPSQFMALQKELEGTAVATNALYDSELLQAVFSRHPLAPAKSMKGKGQAQKVLVAAPEGKIAVFNVHPLRRGGWRARYAQIAALLEGEIAGLSEPVLLAGDFNVTEKTELYALISRYLRNAHDAAGSGFGFTFPSGSRRFLGIPLFPLVRIDHIFCSAHFRVLSASTVPGSGGSDHLPVVAEIALATSYPDAETSELIP